MEDGGHLFIHLNSKQGSRSARLSPQSMTWDECKVGSVSEGTDFGQKKNLNQRVYWFMV